MLKSVPVMLVGEVIIYAFGMTWLAIDLHLGAGATIAAGLTPFLAGCSELRLTSWAGACDCANAREAKASTPSATMLAIKSRRDIAKLQTPVGGRSAPEYLPL